MESIDRLREYGALFNNSHDAWSGIGTEILEFADEIEHEVEDNERFRREAEPFHDRLCRASERREDVTLWGVDYTALPLDAEGVPIHVGDKLTDGEYTFVVDELAAFGDGSWSIRNEDGNAWAACDVTQYRAPTVEDVLHEFLVAWAEWKDGAAMMNPVETFAAKLRLAGDE